MFTKRAGRINGNPLCGLCERVCLDVRQVIDGSVARYSNRVVSVPVSPPAEAVFPYEPILVQSVGRAVLTDLVVSPTETARSRVRYTLTIPLTVRLSDASGASFDFATEYTFSRDILLTVPQDVPYEIEAAASFYSRIGSFVSERELSLTACIVVITRVVVSSQLLLPSYGECEYPLDAEYADSQSCLGAPDPRFP